MRLTSLRIALAGSSLILIQACTKEPQPGSTAANAAAAADQLEAKADNYEMLADNSADTGTAGQLENASSSLDEQAANLRASANPKEDLK